MRRVVPWALLIALLVGVGVGAVVGQVQAPGQTPTQWVGGVLATTKAAGTARITYVSKLTSATPAQQSSTTGSGVVDFRTGSVKFTEVSRSYETSSTDGGPSKTSLVRDVDETIEIGKSSYQKDFGSWTKTARETSAGDPPGLDDALGPFTLGPIGGGQPVAGVEDLGPATVGGVATTRYLVTMRLPSCAAVQAAFEAGNYWRPTTLWVDSQGRLVQVRSAMHLDLKIPQSLQEELLKQEEKALQKAPSPLRNLTPPALLKSPIQIGPEVIIVTLHLTDLGAPVHITAPVITSGSASFSTSQSMLSKTVLTGGGGRVAARSHTC
jgi:hypothetical protein